MKNKKISWPEYIFIFSLLAVIFSLLAFYFIDLQNIFSWRDKLFATKSDYFFFSYRPFFFHHWGRNSGIAETIQFLMLGFSAVGSAYLAGQYRSKDKKMFKFWSIMSLGLLLMLLEDAGNLRHTFMSYIQAIFQEAEQGLAGTGFELLYFGVLGGIPLYALIRYGGVLGKIKKAKNYILTGFVFYFLAGGLSFIGTAFSKLIDKNFYTILGEKLYSLSLKLGDDQVAVIWENWEATNWRFPIGFFLMDSLIEENLEIIGAGAFLAGVISFLIYKKRQSETTTQ